MDNVNVEIYARGTAITRTFDLDSDHWSGIRATQPENSQDAGHLLFALSLFDRLSTPLFMVTRRKIVIWANASCRCFFAQSSQLSLQGDQLRAGAPRQRAALQAFLEVRPEHRSRPQPDVFVLEGQSGEDGALLVRLTQPFSMLTDQNQILGIVDPTTGSAKPNALAQHLYSLTEAEHALCAALAAGHRLKDWARLRRVTMNTARAQAKSVLAKMGVTSQQDVVRIWLSLGVIDCSAPAANPAGPPDVTARPAGLGIDLTSVPADRRMPQSIRATPGNADGRSHRTPS